ncbi:MAG TPA: PDZ domain-containing protein [Terriglobales bacterium]|nr:PDZ domain-containing protein [Terriglobales bacterium]
MRLVRLMLPAVAGLALAAAAAAAPPESPLLLLQSPTMSRTQIAFVYGGDIWIAPRTGGAAHRLVTGFGLSGAPYFSPDGTEIAFSGDYDGNTDVYVVPAAGGEPKRLTYHPYPDVAVGWTPDGAAVLFRSNRSSYSDPDQLFTVPVHGGFATELPLPMAEEGSFSPDGRYLAYVPNSQWERFWQGYRGGQTTPIWIARLADSSVVKIPRENSNDSDPMWVGKTVYFLSDRNGAVSLFAYDTVTQRVTEVVNADGGFDITDASAGPDGIIYSQFGQLHIYNFRSHRTRPVEVSVAGDMPQLRPHWENVEKQIEADTASLSPTGERALFEAHGEILTVPAKHGDPRNLTQSPGVMDRDPAWSPDGQWIAYFSDRDGEYDLRIRDQKGLHPARTIRLGNRSSFYQDLTWSPDSKKLAFSDQALHLWIVSADGAGAPVPVDTDLYETPLHEFDPAWSPDSRWLAYTKQLPNHLRAVFIYSLADHSVHQVTDGMSDCLYPQFDSSGKYLYFTASTNMGLSAGWLDMTSLAHPVTRSVYIAVLRNDLPSPLPPESDDEKAEAAQAALAAGGHEPAGAAAKPAAAAAPAPVRIDFDGILQRTLALPVPPANYAGLQAAPDSTLFLASLPPVATRFGPPRLSVSRFTLKTRKSEPLLTGVANVAFSHDGKKMLFLRAQHWYIAATDHAPKPDTGELQTAGLQVYVVPREEWAEMYHDVWRIERAYYYDPGFHGLDIAAAEAEFAHYLPGIASRADLNFLFEEMLSYLSVGHMFVRGGAQPPMHDENVGLLGADYRIANGKYQFAKIYSGENWNPNLHAPLTAPGVNVEPGDYLLAVNGRPLDASEDIYQYFQQTAGKQVTLEVGPNADGQGAREVVVTPVASERGLRNLDWMEANRRLVDRLSHGELAYVYLPDTGFGGFTNFNRYYFSQVGKRGAIIDERFNHGGDLSDYIIDYLRRTPMSLQVTKHGQGYLDPQEAIFGPKVMIINQFAGSGGDALPWYFRKAHVGTLVGVRTWGGLVGIGGYPRLMDGGSVTAPRWAIGGLTGHWEVENHGIAPDVTVWQDPALVRKGEDPQLLAAVQIAMKQIAEAQPLAYPKIPYPNHHPVLPPLPGQTAVAQTGAAQGTASNRHHQ